uniref:NADH-ubiquinone oxidoreductase chain 2 n=1 Tax=Ictinogomphus sp. MT-2014 TaxID=1560015 RepID=A0A0A0VD00_9ODON|nr:NADH dehydrogenase subunit 2 [Ictinogomphus sp. MT-2014]
MTLTPSSSLFLISLITSSMICISSSTWIGAWMGLEMNLLSFIPLMNKNKTPYENEAAMKYFLVQAMASVIFLLSIMMSSMLNFDLQSSANYLMTSALLMKMGAAPFHFWFPGVMEGLEWMNCLILMTWQKLAPFILLSYKLNLSLIILMVVIMSAIVGSVGGINQSSVRKMMAYSSISHLGWMITAMLISKNYWMLYFFIYTLLNFAVIFIFQAQSIYHLSQIYYYNNPNTMNKITTFISLLSLGGLPPFLGFLPKWMVIQNMMSLQYTMLAMILVMTTLITLFFYLRMMFSAFTFINQEMKWLNSNNKSSVQILLMALSITGIPMLMMIPT